MRKKWGCKERKIVCEWNGPKGERWLPPVGTSLSSFRFLFTFAKSLPLEVCIFTHIHTQFIPFPYSLAPFRNRQGQQLLHNVTFSADSGRCELVARTQQQGRLPPPSWHYKICLPLSLRERKGCSTVGSTKQMYSTVADWRGCCVVQLFADRKLWVFSLIKLWHVLFSKCE